MEFLATYGLFLLKLISIAFAIIFVLFSVVVVATRIKERSQERLCVTHLNEKYHDYEEILFHATKTPLEIKRFLKSKKKIRNKKNKSRASGKRTFVLNFNGDVRASAVTALREEITAVLMAAHKNDEVLLRLESAGGLVHAYGLAASQLQRIKEANIKLTIAIDKIAASGGYLMAVVADHVIAAPFAIVGSIGVLAQLPNFHRLLQKKSIDFEQLTAGDHKRTLTMFGENTEKDREKMQQEINHVHVLFKDFIQKNRQQVNIDKVANGEHWYGTDALQLQLVDALQTSDDYLLAASQQSDIYEVAYKVRKSLSKKLSHSVSQCYDALRQSA